MRRTIVLCSHFHHKDTVTCFDDLSGICRTKWPRSDNQDFWELGLVDFMLVSNIEDTVRVGFTRIAVDIEPLRPTINLFDRVSNPGIGKGSKLFASWLEEGKTTLRIGGRGFPRRTSTESTIGISKDFESFDGGPSSGERDVVDGPGFADIVTHALKHKHAGLNIDFSDSKGERTVGNFQHATRISNENFKHFAARDVHCCRICFERERSGMLENGSDNGWKAGNEEPLIEYL